MCGVPGVWVALLSRIIYVRYFSLVWLSVSLCFHILSQTHLNVKQAHRLESDSVETYRILNTFYARKHACANRGLHSYGSRLDLPSFSMMFCSFSHWERWFQAVVFELSEGCPCVSHPLCSQRDLSAYMERLWLTALPWIRTEQN